MSVEIGNDIIDSRDVEERIGELRSELEGTPFASAEHGVDTLVKLQEGTPAEWREVVDWDDDSVDELIGLVRLQELGQGSSRDWVYGETLIHESYFQDYAEQLANEIGAINRDAGWPANFIDWAAAAQSLKQDYSAIEVGNHTYYIRSS